MRNNAARQRRNGADGGLPRFLLCYKGRATDDRVYDYSSAGAPRAGELLHPGRAAGRGTCAGGDDGAADFRCAHDLEMHVRLQRLGKNHSCPSRAGALSVFEYQQLFRRYAYGILIHSHDQRTNQHIAYELERQAFLMVIISPSPYPTAACALNARGSTGAPVPTRRKHVRHFTRSASMSIPPCNASACPSIPSIPRRNPELAHVRLHRITPQQSLLTLLLLLLLLLLL